MSYKLLADGGVKRLADGACIPNEPANFDWQAYQGFLAGGGVPLPADPPPAPDNSSALTQREVETALDDLERAIDAGDTHNALRLIHQVLLERK